MRCSEECAWFWARSADPADQGCDRPRGTACPAVPPATREEAGRLLRRMEEEASLLGVVAEDAASALSLWEDLSAAGRETALAGECALEILASWAHLQCFPRGEAQPIFAAIGLLLKSEGAMLASKALPLLDPEGWVAAVAAADQSVEEAQDPTDALLRYRALGLFQELYDASLAIHTVVRLKLASDIPSLSECYFEASGGDHAPLFLLASDTAAALAAAYRDDLAIIDPALWAVTDLPVSIAEAAAAVSG